MAQQPTKTKRRRKRKRKRGGAIGLLALELIGIVAFAALLTAARSSREAAPSAADSARQRTVVQSSTGWPTHRPRFSQMVSDLWEAGF